MSHSLVRPLLALGLLGAPAFAQGVGLDDCAQAGLLLGDGTWAFDTTLATTDGAPDLLCSFAGEDQIAQDVWYLWTATVNGTATIDTCGQTTVDTRVAVYDGTDCATAPLIVCGDDACGLQTLVTFAVDVGDTYLVRLGNYPLATGGPGTFTVSQNGVPVSGDTCGSAFGVVGTGVFGFDSSAAGTDGTTPSCLASIDKDVFFAWTPTASGTYTLSTCGLTSLDTAIAVYDGVSCPASVELGCNDDDCGLQSSVDVTVNAYDEYLIRVGSFSGTPGGSGALRISSAGGACAGLVSGPDLVVEDILDATLWGSIGGLAAYSFGAKLANRGDQDVAFEGATAQHPVVTQQLFRLFDGRFEQIGMSWAQHLGDADNGADLCACADPQSAALLGPGCDHLLSAVAMGTQDGVGGVGGLGPRGEVDVFDGALVFPYTGAGASLGVLDRRLQVDAADLDPSLYPNARYFVETQVVAEDEAAGGNHFDSASYREVTVAPVASGGSDFDLIPLGPTRVGQPVLRAWQAVDPGVHLEDVLIPGEGLFLVGSRVTDNGDGTWRYEYAVQNRNSSLAGGSFSVPLPMGVTASGATYSGEPHHSGEVFDVLDWTLSVLSDRVQWATDDALLNPDANALRFGQVFGFGFDADQPPIAGAVELGLFDMPGIHLVAAQVPLTPLGPPPPPNDDCSAAEPISGLGTWAYDTTSASTSGFDGGGASACAGPVNQDVFFAWTAPFDGDFQFDTCGAPYDTRLAVYLGAGDCSATCLDENDDACLLASMVHVPGVQAGDVFLVQVGGFSTATGAANLRADIAAVVPPNDDCSTPTPISGETTVWWNNLLATTSGFDGGNPGQCMSPANPNFSTFGQAHNDLFWAWTATCAGDWHLTTLGSTTVDDTRLSVHQGDDCSATCLGSNDDIGGDEFLSALNVLGVPSGASLLIQVGTWVAGSKQGTGVLVISRVDEPCPDMPFNLLCDPASVHEGGQSATLVTSTLDSGVGSGLHLEATDGPPGMFGFTLVSATNQSGIPVFNGVLCLGAPAARYSVQVSSNQGLPQLNSIGQFDGAGVLVNLAGTSAAGTGFDVPTELPFTPVGQTIQPGDTFSFQVWFRDSVVNPGDSANFTNLIEVTF